jgi:type I restriction enzyme, R subunit
MPNPYGELQLIENTAIEIFRHLGYEYRNCYHKDPAADGRATLHDTILTPRLRNAIERLNPGLSEESVNEIIDKFSRDRSSLSWENANFEIYKMLWDGVKVKVPGKKGGDETQRAYVIDWNDPYNNDFFLASQFSVLGEMYERRPDLVVFVNGIPLVVIELKSITRRLEAAYRENLRAYKEDIPQLFWTNAAIILSNGNESRIGTITSEWEHFAEWKKIDSEAESGRTSLDTMIKGTCEPARLLDLIGNFTLFELKEATVNAKILAKNHQYLGVNNAIESLKSKEENDGRLGVFWHTQGSGKSYSMIFFSQKVLRKLPGNFTFVIVTDRVELDNQIYNNFVKVGAVTEEEIRAESGEELKKLLRENHRHIFTLIHKFHNRNSNEPYPVLSERSDLIVITDEAHRSQYDQLALNMRNALPNAGFIAFTGTPLIAGEEKTRSVFGDYVSIYNFKQSVDDNATVPLYYENRIPELQITNAQLNDDLQGVIESAMLNETQEKKLEREFAREYHLITRDDRLEKVAEDIVLHFMGRGFHGKAMVVSIDKAAAVRMYDKVQEHWKRHIYRLENEMERAADNKEREELREKIEYMKSTDMVVVVSSSQNEIADFREKGLDIEPHRRRMNTEDLAEKFKDPHDPFRIVFVCAMWMTGFDAPAVSTIYLDKPMRNHTLMQTIARANRVFGEKVNGLIVDYIGVFRDLQKALAIYGAATDGSIDEGEMPVKEKSELINIVREAIDELHSFCDELGVDLKSLKDADSQDTINLIADAADAIIVNDHKKKRYLLLSNRVHQLYKAMLPDKTATEFQSEVMLIVTIARKIREETGEPADISEVMEQVEKVLDKSISAKGYVIREPIASTEHLFDLSNVDFDTLRKQFEKGRKRIQADKLRNAISRKLTALVQMNKMRVDYLERFQKLIDEYNAGAYNVQLFFDKLVAFAQELNEEEKRTVRENLTEEELAIFDILTKPDIELPEREKREVKKVARDLLKKLKDEKLVIDWRKRQQSRAQVVTTIRDMLDEGLPRNYTPELYEKKCDLVYQHIFESYYGQGRSLYVRGR